MRAGNIYYSSEVLRVNDLNCFQLSAIKPLGDERGEYFACVKFYASHLFPSSALKLLSHRAFVSRRVLDMPLSQLSQLPL